MLNEKEELTQYIGKVNTCNRLISWSFFYKHRGGIPRALTILARHYLYDVYRYASLRADKQKTAREKVKHLLAAWCGFDFIEGSEEFIDGELIEKDDLAAWLPRYLLAHPYQNANMDFMKNEILSFRQERAKKWYVKEQKDIYQLVNHTFSIHSVNLYTIIADAVNQGPLLVWELVYDEEAFSRDIALTSTHKKYILCIISAYLLALGDTPPDGQPILLNNVDLANWMEYASLARGNHFEKILDKVSGSISYSDKCYIIQKQFLEKYHFKVQRTE